MRSDTSFPRSAAAASALLAVAVFACAKQPPPEMQIESGPGAEITADGLHRVSNSLFEDAWVKPDADFAAYGEIMLDLVSISYKRKPTTTRYPGTKSNFALTKGQMEDFKRYFREAFERELSEGEHYELVETAGPQTLRVAAEIIDLVIKVPTQVTTGSERLFTSSTGEMTLLMELRDALSGEILARVSDRREARAPGAGAPSDLYYSSVVSQAEDVRRVFRRWAQILKARLDQIHELEPTEKLEDTG
jgi:hypothetical protein